MDGYVKSVPTKIANSAKNGPNGKATDAAGTQVKNFVNNIRNSKGDSNTGSQVSTFAQQNNQMNWPKPPAAQEYANRPLEQTDYLAKSPANNVEE